MKVKRKENQCLLEPLKSCTLGLDPPSPKHQRFTFFIDIEHWTQSLNLLEILAALAASVAFSGFVEQWSSLPMYDGTSKKGAMYSPWDQPLIPCRSAYIFIEQNWSALICKDFYWSLLNFQGVKSLNVKKFEPLAHNNNNTLPIQKIAAPLANRIIKTLYNYVVRRYEIKWH